VGIAPTDLDLLVTEAMKQTRLLPNNPRTVTKKDLEMLYSQAM
jgi:alcohol dehydrogenase class IV